MSTKYTLKYPIKFEKSTIDHLTFNDHVTAADLLAFDERGANRQTIILLSNLTNQDEAVIKKLHVTDFRACDVIATKMLEPEATEKNVQES
ncbi:MAG: phage tail assembly protein [Methylophilus sp.]